MPGERVFASVDARLVDVWRGINDTFYLFRADLHATDIDGAARATQEVITTVPELNSITSVDETVSIGERLIMRDIALRRACGADPQAAFGHSELYSGRRSVQQFGRKAGAPIIH